MADLTGFQRIHIVGIGGAGMSAIARVLRGRGFTVTGSDRGEGLLVTALRAEGIPVAVGHAPENLGAAELVLASSAVPDENPELVAARAQGVPVLRRPEFLAALTAGYDVIAIAGAHGKTTVSGMIATILLAAGLDPTFIVGGVVANLGTNARVGQGRHFVIEADEYRNTFLALEPQIAVVTNVEYDHPDSFPSPKHLRLAFGEFVEQIRPGGLLVACADDPVAHAVGASYHANGGRLVRYGRSAGATWQVTGLRANESGGVDGVVWWEGHEIGLLRLRLPGEHNAVNALAAVAVASALEIPWETSRKALESFAGTERRFEILGEAAGVVVVDDYAHHPTQIKAVLAAARQRYPERRIIAVWQPHTYSRIKALWGEFLAAFEQADRVLILPIYAAREVDDGTVSHRDLAARLHHGDVVVAESLADAVERLAAEIAPDDLVLLMGAGDEYLVGRQLLARLPANGCVEGRA